MNMKGKGIEYKEFSDIIKKKKGQNNRPSWMVSRITL